MGKENYMPTYEFFLENRWLILVSLEVLAWTSTFFMLYARYRIGSPILFRLGTLLTILTGVIPQIIMGIINFISVGQIDLFTGIIILLILYGLTLGRKKIKQLDQWAQLKFSRKQTR